MYSKQEAAQLKQEFWTRFGQYMSPILSAEGEKINWINYKTGEKNVNIRMDVNNRSALIRFELSHSDAEIQQLYYQHLQSLKAILESSAGTDWQWYMHEYDDLGRLTSGLRKTIEGVSIFNKSDWPDLISFFKPGMIALDDFWSNVKYSFEALR